MHAMPLDDPPAERAASSEEDLLVRLRRGDGDAFGALVRSESGKLLALARRMLRDEEDARDVVQEAFATAFQRLDGFKGDCLVTTWLFRIAANAALMRLRSRRRRPEGPLEELLPRFYQDGHRVVPIGDRELPDPQRDACSNELRSVVRACVEALPERYRSVLMLRDLAELSTDEAAALLGTTPNAVKIRLHRARQALRELLVTRRHELLPP
jgi:RNA polymerase sigma-70 factor (ECF subfamily)